MPAENSNNVRLAFAMAWRLLGHGENKFARFVTWVSFIGLALGVMILTVVVTVMNGFDRELKDRLLSSIPHVTVQGVAVDDVSMVLEEQPNVIGVHRYFSGLGALAARGQVHAIVSYGTDERGRSSLANIDQTMSGDLDDLFSNKTGIVIGAPLARYLGLVVGDPVVMLAVKKSQQSVAPVLLRFELVGTFELGAELDYNLILVNLARMPISSWQNYGEVGTQIQLREPLMAPVLVSYLERAFPQAEIDSWNTAYGELFQAVQLEKSMMFVLLILVVAIASFNIIAGQTMVVNDKRSSIAILRTMGASHNLVLQVFLLQGAWISLLGTIIGLVFGLLCAFNINEILNFVQTVTGMHLLDGSFFVQVPIRVDVQDLALIGAMSGGLCLLSAWLPARRAAQLNPIEALHYS